MHYCEDQDIECSAVKLNLNSPTYIIVTFMSLISCMFLYVLCIWYHKVRLLENVLICFCASYRAHTGESEEFLNRS